MAVKKRKIHRKTHPKKKRIVFNINRGATSIGVLIILLIVFIIFLSSLFLNFNPTAPKTGSQITTTLPTLAADTGGGIHAFNITPVPSNFSPSMCQVLTNDIVLLIDNSGSMRGDKLVEAKEAAKIFVDLIAINPKSRVSVVVFDKTSTVISPLTSDFRDLKSKIDQIKDKSNTCIQCGVKTANEQLQADLRDDVKRSIVLLSDGKGNHVNGVRSPNANQEALKEMQSGFSSNAAAYFTIAIGKDADHNFMRSSATTTQGAYYSTTSQNGLTQAFATVATDICTSGKIK